MKKMLKRSICLLAVLCIIAGFGPMKAQAYEKKGEYKMDILECPYNRYFTELGCPELTKVFCDNDERMYGNLAGIKFERQGTIGKGADHCDFYVRNV